MTTASSSSSARRPRTVTQAFSCATASPPTSSSEPRLDVRHRVRRHLFSLKRNSFGSATASDSNLSDVRQRFEADVLTCSSGSDVRRPACRPTSVSSDMLFLSLSITPLSPSSLELSPFAPPLPHPHRSPPLLLLFSSQPPPFLLLPPLAASLSREVLWQPVLWLLLAPAGQVSKHRAEDSLGSQTQQPPPLQSHRACKRLHRHATRSVL
mmetsp:Transcript_3147/g.7418  ORF Transcript_3147/g.7418 Transcript_3147/m.7418 type:complete len:210 (+) Transcript_3147:1568-2197(+)